MGARLDYDFCCVVTLILDLWLSDINDVLKKVILSYIVLTIILIFPFLLVDIL